MVFGSLGLLLNISVLVSIYRVGLLGRRCPTAYTSNTTTSSPVFVLVSLLLIDGIFRCATYSLYLGPSVIAGTNLGDGPERHGFWSHLMAQLACATFNMATRAEVLIAVNRLLVVKRVVVDGCFAPGLVDRLFSRRNCLVYAAVTLPWEWTFQNHYFLDVHPHSLLRVSERLLPVVHGD